MIVYRVPVSCTRYLYYRYRYLYPGTLPVQVSAGQSYDRSIELSIYFFYWFLLFIYYFIIWHHMLSWHSGSQRVVQFASSVTNIVDFDDIGVFKNTLARGSGAW